MKKTNLFGVMASAASLAFAMAPAMANASDGTITFTGSVTASTCTIAVNNGTATATVKLPAVSTKSMTKKGEVAGATNFDIVLSSCTTGLKSAVAFFEMGPTVDASTSNLTNAAEKSTAATLVEVQLLDRNGKALKPGDQNQLAASSYVTLVDNGGTLTYGAQYYAMGQVGAGTVSSSVTYSISYL